MINMQVTFSSSSGVILLADTVDVDAAALLVLLLSDTFAVSADKCSSAFLFSKPVTFTSQQPTQCPHQLTLTSTCIHSFIVTFMSYSFIKIILAERKSKVYNVVTLTNKISAKRPVLRQ